MSDLTAERLQQVLTYNSYSGLFKWNRAGGSGGSLHVAGDTAGCISRGYIVIWVDDKLYLAHRLAWLYVTGEWPKRGIDHWDTDKSNNSWGNLRSATQSQNLANQRISPVNTSGFKGVCWHKLGKKWMAQIKVDGRHIYLGLFETAEEAHAVYVAAAEHHFGEFARAA